MLLLAIKGRKNPIKVHAFTKWRPEGRGSIYCLSGQTNESIGNGLFKINNLICYPTTKSANTNPNFHEYADLDYRILVIWI